MHVVGQQTHEYPGEIIISEVGYCLYVESQGRGSLMGCRLWGRTELDTTEVT